MAWHVITWNQVQANHDYQIWEMFLHGHNRRLCIIIISKHRQHAQQHVSLAMLRTL